jgi:hypothetical protein
LLSISDDSAYVIIMTTTTDSSGLITKTTVILEKPSDWSNWLMLRRDKAESTDIWDYCNPDQPKEELGAEPTRPRITDYKSDATKLSDLSEALQKDYRDALETFTFDYPRWEKKDRALRALATEILATVAARHLYLLKDQITAYDRLKTLKQHLCPSDRTRERELQTKFRDLSKSPRGRGVEKWLEEWITVTDQCSELNMAEVAGIRAQEEFLIAVKPIQDTWATNQLDKLYTAHEDGEELSSIRDLIATFKIFHRRVNPTASSLGTFGATLQAAQPAVQSAAQPEDDQDRSKMKKKPPKCLCGDRHWYQKCQIILSILAPDRASKDARIDPAKKTKVEEALQDQKTKQRVQGVLSRYPSTGKRNSQTENNVTTTTSPFDIDGGQPIEGTPHTYALQAVALSTAIKQPPVPHLMNRWILDPGSNAHVCNSKSFGWKKTRDAKDGEIVFAGGQAMQIQQWGEVILDATGPSGPRVMRLTMVAYVEGFFANILGLSRCRDQGVHFDSGRDLLYLRTPQNVFCHLEFDKGHWLIDANPSTRPEIKTLTTMTARFRPSVDPRPTMKLTAREAHQIWGHPGAEAVKHLSANVIGVELKGSDPVPTWTDCKICIETKMHQLISRRPSSNPATRPFYRIGIDLVQLCPRGTDCYNGDKYGLHAVDEYTEWHEAVTLATRAQHVLVPALKALIVRTQRQFNYWVVVLRIDNDTGYGNDLYDACRTAGIKVEPRSADTPQQNGRTEKAGDTLVKRMRALHHDSGIPQKFANELFVTGAHLQNVTPIKKLEYKTSFEAIHGRPPSVAHFAPIGCRAYVHRKDLKKADRLRSRVRLGYLLGYDSTNIYRIWVPELDRVVRTRDVVFDRSTLYKDDQAEKEDKEELRNAVNLLDVEQELIDATTEDLMMPLPWNDPESHENNQADVDAQLQKGMGLQEHELYPTPEPSTSSQHSRRTTPENNTIAVNTQSRPSLQPTAQEIPLSAASQPGYVPDRRTNNAPQAYHPNVGDTRNVIDGQRVRRQAPQAPGMVSFPSRKSRKEPPPPSTAAAYYATFAATLASSPQDLRYRLNAGKKLHRDQLPPPPKRYKDLRSHVFGPEFIEASKVEFRNCWAKQCFQYTELEPETVDGEILPLMWVYTYKFDEDGYLSKFKARLVVRGDLEAAFTDPYAATLAAKHFRALVALAAAFDLLMFQYDVNNAFLNAKVLRRLYVWTPEGFKDEHGKILLLLRALYGLREAPLLWYQELRSTLRRLGLNPVDNAPCVWTNKHLIVFFFVDDIVILVHPSNLHVHRQFEEELLNVYKMRKLGQLKWFLGIRVVRDWETHRIWLIQDSFINKVATKFNLRLKGKAVYPDVPLKENWLPKSTEPPNENRTKLYQELVGSLAYLASFTRPETARAHSVLARHLQNPGQKHLHSVIHAWRYVIGSETRAICADGRKIDTGTFYGADQVTEPAFFGASDASYADEPDTLRSSEGYVFMLAGMPIDWKATIQRTVTKSTTEAETVSLGHAATELRAWEFFMNGVQFDPGLLPTILCDNQQTVGVVTKPPDRYQTRMKHVNIQRLWVRQEVEAGRLAVQWVPTAEMPADGFTKILPRQKHHDFVRQLGLMNITAQLETETHSVNDGLPEDMSRWF